MMTTKIGHTMLLQEIFETVWLMEDRVDHAAKVFGTKLLAAQEKDSSAKKDLSALDLAKLLSDKVDPTKNKQNVLWIAKMYANGEFKLEDVSRLKADLTLFEKVKAKLKNKDLNSYKNLGDLYDALKPFEGAPEEELLSGKEKAAAVKSKDAEVFMDEPGFKVIIPKTHEASCLYGKGTKWCTASKEDTTHFESYSSRGPLFIILTKLDGVDRKFQLHYEDDAFMDERDQKVKKADIDALSKLPAYTKFINKLIKKHYHPHILDK